MIKTTLAALIAVAAVSAAAPAFASPVVIHEPASNPYYSETVVLDRLQHRGFNVVAVENWGQLIRAYVIQADGRQAQLFFKRDTLAPVAL